MLQVNTRLKALDDIHYKIYTLLHTVTPVRKTMESASGKRHPDEAHGPGEETSFSPLEFNRKTMKSASGKRPPDKAHNAPEKKRSSRISWA